MLADRPLPYAITKVAVSPWDNVKTPDTPSSLTCRGTSASIIMLCRPPCASTAVPLPLPRTARNDGTVRA